MTDWSALLAIGGALVLLLGPTIEAATDRLGDWVEGDDSKPSPAEQARQAYVRGEISEAGLEDRLALLLDDRATTIRDLCDDVDGIGEELSADLAREFDTVGELKAADAEDLQAVDGIGETRAQDLLEEL